ncbi:MAG: hypothetical protein J3Q66DRAFT_419542 [Benniella sp.]|nr:MAG: hypothetical protein J3Q66DRAFT_419542 [Benniella sp.]
MPREMTSSCMRWAPKVFKFCCPCLLLSMIIQSETRSFQCTSLLVQEAVKHASDLCHEQRLLLFLPLDPLAVVITFGSEATRTRFQTGSPSHRTPKLASIDDVDCEPCRFVDQTKYVSSHDCQLLQILGES